MGYIPDYNDMLDAYYDKQERELKKLPKCYICGKRIQDDYMYEINDEFICEECLKDNYRKNVEEYIDE